MVLDRVLLVLILSFCSCTSLKILKPIQESEKDLRYLFLDLDNTLYSSKDIIPCKYEATELFIQEKTTIPTNRIASLIVRFKGSYENLVSVGMEKELGLDSEEYDRHVDHSTQLDQLKENAELKKFLDTIKALKFVLTNSGLEHATTALKRLGILGCFNGIIFTDSKKQVIHYKSEEEFYKEAMNLLEIGPEKSNRLYFIDDIPEYLYPAKRIGWNVAHLRTGDDEPTRHNRFPVIKTLYELANVFPELFH